uniref:Vascular endothelial growth factor n=1 Tax=Orf virus TaxID=10258 RepID=D0VXD7_ORFV|nr:vascular endothelial growth factor [Orf virus]BAI50011.1 vascular endothelial growth factor [Orf virus]BAI50012.1 vascular endothelial growth factor [Orf virus]BAI50013.1 vascular endothelial growth factor [Orf virus]BAJ12018.1 vascular endothelial growth factor [Orf virus]
MRLLVCILVVVCLLHQHLLNADSSTKKWPEVLEGSKCKPRPTVLSVNGEHPELTSQRFNPPCVTLMRCGGCCNDESLECVPTEEANVTMEFMGVGVSSTGSSVSTQHLEFVEHTKCDCQPRGGQQTTTPPRRRRRAY